MTRRVAFLPGATGDPAFWGPVAARLGPGFAPTRFGWPGAGEQPARDDVRGYGDLVKLVSAATPDGSDVVAQSMGGAVAIGLALARPAAVRRLVLVATSGGLDLSAFDAAAWREAYHAAHPDAAGWVTDERPSFADRLGEITAPTLLVWGDADPISPMSVGEHLRSILPNARLHVVAGGDHDLARDRADEVAAVIRDHLSAP